MFRNRRSRIFGRNLNEAPKEKLKKKYYKVFALKDWPELLLHYIDLLEFKSVRLHTVINKDSKPSNLSIVEINLIYANGRAVLIRAVRHSIFKLNRFTLKITFCKRNFKLIVAQRCAFGHSIIYAYVVNMYHLMYFAKSIYNNKFVHAMKMTSIHTFDKFINQCSKQWKFSL